MQGLPERVHVCSTYFSTACIQVFYTTFHSQFLCLFYLGLCISWETVFGHSPHLPVVTPHKLEPPFHSGWCSLGRFPGLCCSFCLYCSLQFLLGWDISCFSHTPPLPASLTTSHPALFYLLASDLYSQVNGVTTLPAAHHSS